MGRRRTAPASAQGAAQRKNLTGTRPCFTALHMQIYSPAGAFPAAWETDRPLFHAGKGAGRPGTRRASAGICQFSRRFCHRSDFLCRRGGGRAAAPCLPQRLRPPRGSGVLAGRPLPHARSGAGRPARSGALCRRARSAGDIRSFRRCGRLGGGL